MKHMKHLFTFPPFLRNSLLFAFLFTCSISWGQLTYPVSTKVTVTPPYPTYLSGFEELNKVMVTVTLTDPTKNGYKVKLRLSITSADKGLTIKTLPGKEYMLQHDLSTNIPVILPDAYKLFDATTLDIPTNIANNGGLLPEGLYYIGVEALDATLATNEPILVSDVNLGGQLAWLTLNDPPFLNFPANLSTINPQVPQNLVFQWTPRHLQSLNSGFDTEYNLYLTPVMTGQNPYQALMSNTSPLSTVSHLQYPYYNFTQLDFKLSDGTPFSLTDGQQYAWQVRAVNTSGKEYFKNQGYSEVFSFFYTSTCPTAVTPTITKINGLSQLNWAAPATPSSSSNVVTGYTIFYRPAGTSSAWQILSFDMTGKENNPTFSQSLSVLDAGKFYDIQLKTTCSKNESDQIAVGTAQNDAVTVCTSGPQQLSLTDDPDHQGQKIFTWESIQGASGYKVKKSADGVSNWTDITTGPLTTTSYSLTLTTIPTHYKVFAICNNEDKEGKDYVLDNTSTGYQSTCVPLDPTGFKTGDLGLDSNFTVEWRTSPIYQSYSFQYRLKGSTSESDWKITETNQVPITVSGKDGQIYEYQITYVCAATNKAQTNKAYFQVQRQAIVTDPTTGNCFPPAHLSSEVTSTSTCDLAWDKVQGANNYQIAYTLAATQNWQIDSTSKTRITLKNLAPNSVYIYKVSVACPGGKNSIYSDTSSFNTGNPVTYSGKCPQVDDFDTLATTLTTISLLWKAQIGYSSYAILYHDVNEDITNWHTLNHVSYFKNGSITATSQDTATITGLSPGSTYEIQIQAYCGTDKAQKSGIKNFSTKKSDALTSDSTFSCGNDANILAPGPCVGPPAQGDVFQAADFTVLADEGGPNGSGRMVLPYMDNAMVEVQFNNISLDANKKLCQGTVSVVGVKFIPVGKTASDAITDFVANANNALNQAQNYLDMAKNAVNQADQYVNGGGNVGNVVDGGVGDPDVLYAGSSSINTISYDPNTKKLTINGNELYDPVTTPPPFTVKGNKDGKLFLIDKNNKATQVGVQGAALKSTLTVVNFSDTVKFSADPTAIYAFDAFKPAYANSIPYSKEYEILAPKYRVASKFMVPKELDYVTGTYVGTRDAANIQFVSGKGLAYTFKRTSNTFQVQLMGGLPKDAQEIYALYIDPNKNDTTAIGKLLVPAYTPINKGVVLVKVGNAKVDQALATAVQAKLDKAFGPIGVHYTVTTDQTFASNVAWDVDGNGIVQDKGSNIFSNDYQGEEADMVSEYLNMKGGQSQLDASSLYLFVNKEVANTGSSDLLGKMPQDEQFGFVFSDNGSGTALGDEVVARTIAHEVGHGAHFLDHTFITSIGIPQYSSDNLMDYSNGTALYKYQWDQIYDPGHVLGIFKKDKDAEGRQETLNAAFVTELLDKIRGYRNYNISYLNVANNLYLDVDIQGLMKKYSIATSTTDVVGEDLELDGIRYDKIAVKLLAPASYTNLTVFQNSVNKNTFSVGSSDRKNVIQVYDYDKVGQSNITNPILSITGYEFYDGTSSTVDGKTKNGQSALYNYLNSINSNPIEYDRLTLFVNGYRNNTDLGDIIYATSQQNSALSEFPNTTNDVYYNADYTNYWGDIDNQFSQRLTKYGKKVNAIYADGHMDITTSNHRAPEGTVLASKLKFTTSLISSSCAQPGNSIGTGVRAFYTSYQSCKYGGRFVPYLRYACNAIIAAYDALPASTQAVIADCGNSIGKEEKVMLDDVSNVAGYNTRFGEGAKAGKNLVDKIKTYQVPVGGSGSTLSVTLDVVAHSMGFAYSMGMIDYLRKQSDVKISFGNFYILAPENACAGTDVTKLGFQNVFQYGSDVRPGGDKKYEQDGIAPQCGAIGLSWGGAQYGRVPFRGDATLKNFIDAHLSASYGWIFDGTLSPGLPGYVESR